MAAEPKECRRLWKRMRGRPRGFEHNIEPLPELEMVEVAADLVDDNKIG